MRLSVAKDAAAPKPDVDSKDYWYGIPERVERWRRHSRLNQGPYQQRRRHGGTAFVKKTDQPPEPARERQIFEDLAAAAYHSYILGCPAVDQLLSLTRINVYRAFINNISLLGLFMDSLCETDIVSPFNQAGPTPPMVKSLPFLCPSGTQRSCHHHPWLNFFPHLPVRDNLIRAQERYDEDELCSGTQTQLTICRWSEANHLIRGTGK
ncbi:hypothetical protein BDV32DRAFT_155202 [Aspergillus pseudonomiae]|uniref:Uncharacterized protein n=1 Tax=Aspergillus pseudonomiae TaxID=1506151 RepID=A0A5N7DDU3_9EURO|nr:uncharacterized protein BDV37DRAFT_282660 [Aspergillus pseudonomiae]KAB8254441.1 hypothetical protein BDV32DRAFT_155202 [Aspergillus pseudonomiae]KAE8404620.1 hypothetical protein BDV37DRAFT_282660 [Aspergillus pseudonomiae]